MLPRQSDEGGDCAGDHTDDRGGDHGDRSEGDHHGGKPVELLVTSAKWPSPATPEPRVIPPRENVTAAPVPKMIPPRHWHEVGVANWEQTVKLQSDKQMKSKNYCKHKLDV